KLSFPAAAAAASGTPQSLKLTYPETLDRIKEEFQFLQTQYHSLKLECEKLATEKTEIQRHYVMYYEMSYGLNIEMHKQVSQDSLSFSADGQSTFIFFSH
uniref:Transducin-like enhancer protein 1 n=1 Tax=Maylandia zebra TaxID=106582 RepID=A0A3P9BPP9_9CICH